MDVYSATRSLTFRIAIGVLLGLRLDEERILYLAQVFGQLINNLFSLPIDAPLSGLRKVSHTCSNTADAHLLPVEVEEVELQLPVEGRAGRAAESD